MEKRWTPEELKYLKENYGKVKSADLKIPGRTHTAILDQAYRLGLTGHRRWTKEDEEYLAESWGSVSIHTIAKNLGRSVSAILNKAHRMELGPFLESGDYISLNQLFIALFGQSAPTYTKEHWLEKGLPVKKRKVANCSFDIIYYEDWWDWAWSNMTIIDFSKMEPLALGPEPKWLEDKRKADIEKSYFKMNPWTEAEDTLLETLLSQYKYTYRELSLRLRRTEGALKRRMIDLGIKARPIKMGNHNPWTPEETKILIDLYHKGHSASTMANYIDRSAQACSGKVERLIKEGVLYPRSEYRKSC